MTATASPSTMKPLTVYGHWGSPNPFKVWIILEELNIPFEWKVIEITDTKSEAMLKVTPNGRIPAIEDPNTGITLWETGAIILYLIDEYDKEGKLSYKTNPEKYLTQQWLMFQVSGQGPYFGQAAWFVRFHSEQLPSAIKRYTDEIVRVVSVLDLHLSRNPDAQYLVGNKCTYADLSFVNWAVVGKGLLVQIGEEERLDKYEHYKKWMGRLDARPVVKGVNQKIAEGRKAHGLPP